MKLPLLGVLAAVLAGCSTTSGLNTKTSVSNFDGVKTIYMPPHGAACKSIICPTIGASWVDNQPNNVGLKIEIYHKIENIRSIAFNVDGEILEIDNLLPTKFNNDSGIPTSSTVVVTDYKFLTKILESKRTWLRVDGQQSRYEVAIIDGEKDSKAFHALKRFDEQVKQEKK